MIPVSEMKEGEYKNLTKKIRDIKTETSTPMRPTKVQYPDELKVRLRSDELRTMADEGKLHRDMKKIVEQSRKRASAAADRDAERLPAILTPQLY